MRIVSAALFDTATGVMVLGPRHFDHTMNVQISQLDERYNQIDWSQAVQGFVDTHGRFLTRQQAHKIAKAQEQFYRGHPDDNEQLNSDNLY